jgi:hypothetical protein
LRMLTIANSKRAPASAFSRGEREAAFRQWRYVLAF